MINVLSIKNLVAKTTGSNLPPGIYETNDVNLMLGSSIPSEVKLNKTIDDSVASSFY